MRVNRSSLILCCAAVCALAIGGCSTPSNPWVFNAPPTTAEPAAPASSPKNRSVVVVGQFTDPTKAPQYSSGVGQAMSDALGRALLHEGRFDVWINPQLSRAVEQIIARPTPQQAEALEELGQAHPDVHYVITGKVTDFYHTSDLPTQASRWGVFGRRSEAVVAVDLRIVDLRTRRVVGADHIKGTASASSSTPSSEIYSGVALDSYVFWSTPLGRASKDTIEQAVEQTARVVPGRIGSTRIAQVLSRRRVSITGGTNVGIVQGREYYLVLPVQSGADRIIRDVTTGEPLTVRIDSASRRSSTGWVRGEAPVEIDLRGSVLRSTIPQQRAVTAVAEVPVD
jgi:curli biogenesis system outer membrane secretion channel CsgG